MKIAQKRVMYRTCGIPVLQEQKPVMSNGKIGGMDACRTPCPGHALKAISFPSPRDRLKTEIPGSVPLGIAFLTVGRMLGRRPTLFYTNSFWKFPVYDVVFGEAARPVRPVRAIPHNLGDPIVLWPAAPPSVGGVELYFSGTLARAVERLGKDDP
ncbi:MAG: hypothetical protein HW386_992 [Gammaproteobacteria bacterium]|nr:hypothetical protein [Gammaproteobacteria bacterium]